MGCSREYVHSKWNSSSILSDSVVRNSFLPKNPHSIRKFFCYLYKIHHTVFAFSNIQLRLPASDILKLKLELKVIFPWSIIIYECKWWAREMTSTPMQHILFKTELLNFRSLFFALVVSIHVICRVGPSVISLLELKLCFPLTVVLILFLIRNVRRHKH